MIMDEVNSNKKPILNFNSTISTKWDKIYLVKNKISNLYYELDPKRSPWNQIKRAKNKYQKEFAKFSTTHLGYLQRQQADNNNKIINQINYWAEKWNSFDEKDNMYPMYQINKISFNSNMNRNNSWVMKDFNFFPTELKQSKGTNASLVKNGKMGNEHKNVIELDHDYFQKGRVRHVKWNRNKSVNNILGTIGKSTKAFSKFPSWNNSNTISQKENKGCIISEIKPEFENDKTKLGVKILKEYEMKERWEIRKRLIAFK